MSDGSRFISITRTVKDFTVWLHLSFSDASVIDLPIYLTDLEEDSSVGEKVHRKIGEALGLPLDDTNALLDSGFFHENAWYTPYGFARLLETML